MSVARISALEIGARLWPDKAQPATREERRDYTGEVRKWLKRRRIVRIAGVCGPAGEALYPADLVEAALTGVRGQGRRLDGDSSVRADAARRGHVPRRGKSDKPLA